MGMKENAIALGIDYTKLSRRTDPATSKSAAAGMVASGKLEGQLLEVLNLVKRYPGHTAFELTKYTTLDRYQISRRTADLQRLNLIRKGTARKCEVSGNASAVWYAND